MSSSLLEFAQFIIHYPQELGMSIHQYQRYEYGESTVSNSPMRIGLRICALLQLDPYDVVLIQCRRD